MGRLAPVSSRLGFLGATLTTVLELRADVRQARRAFNHLGSRLHPAPGAGSGELQSPSPRRARELVRRNLAPNSIGEFLVNHVGERALHAPRYPFGTSEAGRPQVDRVAGASLFGNPMDLVHGSGSGHLQDVYISGDPAALCCSSARYHSPSSHSGSSLSRATVKMSSHGSDQINSEKRAASPVVAAATPRAGGKEKEVHNVRLWHCDKPDKAAGLLTKASRLSSTPLSTRPTSSPGARPPSTSTVSSPNHPSSTPRIRISDSFNQSPSLSPSAALVPTVTMVLS